MFRCAVGISDAAPGDAAALVEVWGALAERPHQDQATAHAMQEAAAAITCSVSFSSAQLTVASMSARPTPCRRKDSMTWRCMT